MFSSKSIILRFIPFLIAVQLSLIPYYSLSQSINDLSFGSESTLDVVTWNIEWFPKNGTQTLNYVAEIIDALDADLIAMQELDDETQLLELMNLIPEWEVYFNSSEYLTLAFLYRPDAFTDINIHTILSSYSRELPRRPLVFDAVFKGNRIVVINNHWKCCGDGYLDENNPWDEETRRRDAAILLDSYMQSNYTNEKVILLGDLNDLLTDPSPHNVFQIFLDQTDTYFIADLEIADGSSSFWSYPSWPSHLDHILITEQLFSSFNSAGSEIKTIRIDDYYSGGWSFYDFNVSDHRPVAIKLAIEEIISDNEVNQPVFRIHPNPAGNTIYLSIPEQLDILEISIYDIGGKNIKQLSNPQNSRELKVNIDELFNGFYQILITDKSGKRYSEKLIIAK